jgi:HEAT repeat protein
MPTGVARILGLSLVLVLLTCSFASAQCVETTSLSPQITATFDRFVPGFTEILESRDSAALGSLAATLSENPSVGSLTALFWMLQHCPSWNGDSVLQFRNVIRSIGRLPAAPVAGALLMNANADQRETAIDVLANNLDLVPAEQKPELERALIPVLSDSSVHIREIAAGILHWLGSPDAEAALARALNSPGATSTFYWQATRRAPPPVASTLTAASFPPATVTAISLIDPDFLNTLAARDDAAMRTLIETIRRVKDPATVPVLVWLLANGDAQSYGERVASFLAEPPFNGRLDVAGLVTQLSAADADHRQLFAQLFLALWRSLTPPLSLADRERVIGALTELVRDSNDTVRRTAIAALGTARAETAVAQLTAALEGANAGRDALGIIDTLGRIGSRDALPALEAVARTTGRPQRVREAAAKAFVDIAKPPDREAELRRLLWEAPDTDLEKDVLVRGVRALPRAQRALTSGDEHERRAAAALLGWFPERSSIAPILSALDRSGRSRAISCCSISTQSCSPRVRLFRPHSAWRWRKRISSGSPTSHWSRPTKTAHGKRFGIRRRSPSSPTRSMRHSSSICRQASAAVDPRRYGPCRREPFEQTRRRRFAMRCRRVDSASRFTRSRAPTVSRASQRPCICPEGQSRCGCRSIAT